MSDSNQNSNLLDFLYAQLAYSIAFNILFGALFIRKVLKLDKLAENLEAVIPRVVWIKFAAILLLIGLLFLHLILSYTSQAYWMNGYSNFSLTVFLYVCNYTLQEYIILKEISRGSQSRFKPNLVFWGVCALSLIIEIIVVEMLRNSSTFSTVLQLLMCILNFGLLLVSLLFEKRSATSPDMLSSLQGESGRSIEDSISHRDRIAPPNRLYIDFNKEFQVTQHQNGMTCEFKIAVYVDQNATIITKSDLEFAKLQIEMIKVFPNKQEAIIPPHQNRITNMMQLGQEKQRIFQNYLLQLTRTGQFIIPALLDFLEIPASLRSRLVCHERSYTKQDSILSEEEERFRHPFFKVYVQKGRYILQNPDFLEFIINRRVEEIVQLHNKLKEEKKITIDVLPENPKEDDIVSFFEIVVNKKSLWRSFSTWFRLDVLLQNKIYNFFDPWTFGFKNVTTQIVGHQIVFDQNGKIHTCYLLSIKNKPTGIHIIIDQEHKGVILKKRYSDFCNLDKHVRRFVTKSKLSVHILPALPPKFSPFGSKTSPKSRQMRLGIYMKELMKIDGINHCIKLLQFLQFDALQVGESVEWVKKDTPQLSQQSYFGDLNDKI